MGTSSAIVTDPLEDELAAAISRRGHDGDANRMAASLLSRDADSARLVGLLDDPIRVVFYDRERLAIVPKSLDSPGRDGDSSDSSGTGYDRSGRSLWEFVLDRGESGWAWLHPRYRWLFGLCDG